MQQPRFPTPPLGIKRSQVSAFPPPAPTSGGRTTSPSLSRVADMEIGGLTDVPLPPGTTYQPEPETAAMEIGDLRDAKAAQKIVEKGFGKKIEHGDESPEMAAALPIIAGKLGSDVSQGLPLDAVEEKRRHYGENYCEPPPPHSIFFFMMEAFKDVTIILLSICGAINLPIGIAFHDPDDPAPGWAEGVALLGTVTVVVLTNAIIDFKKQMQFRALNSANEGTLFCLRCVCPASALL